MSYICLLANKNGAAAAADTRTSGKNLFGKRFRVISDNRTKVFVSDRGKVIWALAGITRQGYSDYFRKVYSVMRDDGIGFEERLEKYKEIMKTGTRRFSKRGKEAGVSTIIYASFVSGEPMAGTVMIKDGEIADERHFELPLFVETGSNYDRLSPNSKLRPLMSDPVSVMRHKAIRRVEEAILKDKELGETDKEYRQAVGGSIKVRSITIE